MSNYVYFNPNPRKRNNVGDCTVRSVAKALNIPWETAYIDLVMQGYDIGDMPSSNLVMNAYLHSKGFTRHVIDDLCPDCFTSIKRSIINNLLKYEHPSLEAWKDGE